MTPLNTKVFDLWITFNNCIFENFCDVIISTDLGIYGFGSNTEGELGDGTTVDKTSFQFMTEEDVIDVQAISNSSSKGFINVFLTSDGKILKNTNNYLEYVNF